MHSIKSKNAHEIKRLSNSKGKICQDESHDRVIRREDEFLEKISYIESVYKLLATLFCHFEQSEKSLIFKIPPFGRNDNSANLSTL